MKKLLLYSIIIICSSLSAVTFDGDIIAKSNYSKVINVKKAKYNNEVGFKVGALYYLVNKKTYYKTINAPHCMFEWNCYTNTNDEYLRVHKPVMVLCAYIDHEVVITFYLYGDNFLNNVIITFDRGEL